MPRDSDWEQRNPQLRAAVNADQAECSAIRYGSANIEAGVADDRNAEAMDDFEIPDPLGVERWAESDANIEAATSDIAKEILRRENVLRTLYPFTIDGNKLVYRQSKTLVYEFCLAVSQSPSQSEGDYARLPQAFERLARDAVRCFLGPGADGFRTGWPRDGFDTRPVRFKALVDLLHEKTGEWHWCPGLGRPDDPTHADVKDGGLDFVVWKKMPDCRKGHLFLLGQCACGDDWTDKFDEINVERLTDSWIRPLSVAPPVRVFVVPHHIPNDTQFCDVNRDAGLTLDRSRLVLLAESPDNLTTMMGWVRDPYPDLIRLVISDFEVGEQAA